MAAQQKERSAKTAARRKTRGEEQGEAMTLMIHHLHALGPQKSAPLLAPPQHVIEVSQNVVLAFHRKSLLMIQQAPGVEVITPSV